MDMLIGIAIGIALCGIGLLGYMFYAANKASEPDPTGKLAHKAKWEAARKT